MAIVLINVRCFVERIDSAHYIATIGLPTTYLSDLQERLKFRRSDLAASSLAEVVLGEIIRSPIFRSRTLMTRKEISTLSLARWVTLARQGRCEQKSVPSSCDSLLTSTGQQQYIAFQSANRRRLVRAGGFVAPCHPSSLLP
jgi:hypothetical protein